MAEQIKMPQYPEPYWRDSVSLPTFPKLDESIDADVGIVGGGIVGITAAYLLSKQNLKVVLIDAGVILNGTTGHTTAKITAQHGLIYNELIEHFGKNKASLYYKACMEAKQLIEETITEHDISCDFKKEDAYVFTNAKSYLQQLETEKKAYDQLDIPGELTNTIPLTLPIKSALIMKDQAQFHPLKYLKVLVEQAVKNGAEIYENTTAVDVEYTKHPAIITRDEHRIKCRYVIEASHYPFYDGQGFYPTRMYPERSYIIAVKTPKQFPGGMYINAESPTRSVRGATVNGEDLWLIVGENHKTGQGKSTMDHYKALQDYAETHFGISEFVYRWSAQDLTTLDKVPYIGPVTGAQQSVFVATGFRKWGMTNGTIAAKVISDQIMQKDSAYADLYTPSRFQADPAIREFTTANADVAKHLIKGKLEFTNDNIKDLSPDDATITRVNGLRTGVYKDKDNKLYAVDTTCKHMGCEVHWNSGDRTWDCPCHGSRYTYTGEVVEGPAKEPLNKVEL
ncbi:FAD-dependent oxidoreductase [Virgibacillus dakarensis]|uniref:(2Fe-2S)-binding protein n=1 Tax=Lentibacillus populi TaxID=1827502 RepID=A0A9W5U287_9BACI|nr:MULTISPECIES: FAD-dependent oxidoreductase [Bacillaceae]MBT2214909.1 FAD-dependent oxidoreductase [Virgibacillus dakarensis]MTW88149.1 FAD-dependent oxidoreductase [Virgibacillus dakarensis]GGB60652.1 (2Fe-2S)-binding protein [Lentibacillus populi]